MAKLWLPDSRLEMPELFETGRKPVGDVKIDWTHPLTRNLQFFTLAHDALDMCRGSFATSSDYKRVVTANGEAMDAEGVTLGAYYSSDIAPEVKNDMTLMALADSSSLLDISMLLGRDESGDTDKRSYQFRVEVDGSLVAIIWPGAITITEVATKDLHLFTFTKEGVDGRLWVDTDSNAHVVPLTIDNDGTGLTVGSRVTDNITLDFGQPFNGGILFAAEWGRSLSPSEVISMSNDPYQFLIPA